MLKCRDVPQHAEQLLAGDLTAGQRFSLRLHLLMCHHCRRYVRQLKVLVTALPSMPDECTDSEILQVLHRLDQQS